MNENKNQSEKESEYEVVKALALRTIVEMFGDDITQDPESTAALMSIYVKGYYDGKS